jgi:MoxR-like ATPase
LASGLVKPVLTPEILTKLRESLEDILVKEELGAYIVDIVRETRRHPSILVGAGPRATQALILAARTHAAINGRDFITPDDIKELALPVLEHRLILRPEFEIEGLTINEVIDEILKEIAVPR